MGLLDFLKKKKEALKKPAKCFFKLFWAFDMIDEYGDIGGSMHRIPIEVFESLKLDGFYIESRFSVGTQFWLTARYKTVELYSKSFSIEDMPCWLKERIRNSKRLMRKLREEGLVKKVFEEDIEDEEEI